eukprot:11761497-Alexandrium_andersonii.AAC.1
MRASFSLSVGLTLRRAHGVASAARRACSARRGVAVLFVWHLYSSFQMYSSPLSLQARLRGS